MIVIDKSKSCATNHIRGTICDRKMFKESSIMTVIMFIVQGTVTTIVTYDCNKLILQAIGFRIGKTRKPN
jgi:hypothetical protein